MNEATAQEVIARYLEEEWKVKLSPRKSGPDFLYRGRIIEVKGSDFRVSKAVRQFARYATEYADFAIAFPADALNSINLIQLHVLGSIWYRAFGQFLTVYLILGKEERFGVLKISDATDLLYKVVTHIRENLIWDRKEMAKLLSSTEFLIKELERVIIFATTEMVDTASDTRWVSLP